MSVRYDPETFDHSHEVREDAAALLGSTNATLIPIGNQAPARSEAAAPDIPGSVGGMIAVSYVTLIGALYVATAGSLSSIFAITIALLFVAVFFTVPRIFFAVEPMTDRRPSLGKFLKRGMVTFTGHSSGPAALVQMLIVPFFLTLAVLAMGLIVALV